MGGGFGLKAVEGKRFWESLDTRKGRVRWGYMGEEAHLGEAGTTAERTWGWSWS